MAHNDSPPSGELAGIFTWRHASEYDEQWVGIDLPTARKIGRRFLRAFKDLPLASFSE